MKKILSLAALMLGINTFSVYLNTKTVFENVVNKQSVILPAYNYPDGKNDAYWKAVTALGGSKIPYVIINPDNGSGKQAEPNYINQIAANKAAGIKNIGYIRTNYQKRSLAKVLAEVDNYYRIYGEDNISGFFFDELAVENRSNTEYMSKIYNYVKSKLPNKIVMGNPGKQINDGIAPYADIFVTSEISADEYINRYTKPESEFENNPKNAKHIMHIVYGAKPNQYETIIRLSRERNAGWLMVTDDKQPNPYDGLSTDFGKLVNLINNLSGVPNPNTKRNTGNSRKNVPKSSNEKKVYINQDQK